jgi:hypothetical protein
LSLRNVETIRRCMDVYFWIQELLGETSHCKWLGSY